LERKNRQYLRKPATFPVVFSQRDGPRRSGICSNISLGGLRIETPEPAHFGSEVTISLDLGNKDGATTVRGIVRWTIPGSMGVQLGLLGARETYTLLRILGEGE
jgi:PilZ domain-containing protein